MRPVIVSLGLVLAAFSSATFGQAEKKEPLKIIVPLDGGYVLQATSKKAITSVATDKEGVIGVHEGSSGGPSPARIFNYGDKVERQVRVNDGIAAGGFDQTKITLYGVGLGETKVKVVDIDKNTDVFQVEVHRQLNLQTGVPFRLQHPSKQAIDKAEIGNDKLARLTNDKTTVQLDPLLAGETTLRLTDAAGKAENWLVQVRVADQTLTVGDKHKLQMSKKQILGQVVVESFRVLEVEPIENDPTAITLVAKGPGIVQVLLVDKDNKQEKLQIGVKAKK
jgi:hypothetical protein